MPPAAARPGGPRAQAGHAGRDVPVAVRQRRPGGEPAAAPQPALRALDARHSPPAAPRRPGGRLQRLAVLPGHRRPAIPRRLRRRDAAGDRPVLRRPRRRYDPATRPVRHPRRDGTRRVPPRLPRRRRPGHRQQRLHQRHDGLGAAASRGRPGACSPPLPPQRARRAAAARRPARAAALARHQPADVRRRSRDGVISQFEGYEDLAEFDWDGYRRRYGDIRRLDRILEAEGDTRQRLQGLQAGRRADAVLPAVRRRAARAADRLGYALDPATHPAHDRVLPGPHRPRLDAERARARLGAGPRRPRGRAGATSSEALGSDVADIQGGTTAEGIHLGAMAGTRRPAAALLHRAGDPARRAVVQPALAAAVRHAWSSPCSTAGGRCWCGSRARGPGRRRPGAGSAVRVGCGEATRLLPPGETVRFIAAGAVPRAG